MIQILETIDIMVLVTGMLENDPYANAKCRQPAWIIDDARKPGQTRHAIKDA